MLQVLSDGSSGYGYEYRKTLRLVKGKPEMELEHSLKNIGKNAIETEVYNHNFLTIDGKGPQAGTTVTLPFAVSTERKPHPEFAAIEGNTFSTRKPSPGRMLYSSRSPVSGIPLPITKSASIIRR